MWSIRRIPLPQDRGDLVGRVFTGFSYIGVFRHPEVIGLYPILLDQLSTVGPPHDRTHRRDHTARRMNRVAALSHLQAEPIDVRMRQHIGNRRAANEAKPESHVIAIVANGGLPQRAVARKMACCVVAKRRDLVTPPSPRQLWPDAVGAPRHPSTVRWMCFVGSGVAHSASPLFDQNVSLRNVSPCAYRLPAIQHGCGVFAHRRGRVSWSHAHQRSRW